MTEITSSGRIVKMPLNKLYPNMILTEDYDSEEDSDYYPESESDFDTDDESYADSDSDDEN